MKKLGIKLMAIAIFVVIWLVGSIIVTVLCNSWLLHIAWLVAAFKISHKIDEALE